MDLNLPNRKPVVIDSSLELATLLIKNSLVKVGSARLNFSER